MSAIYRLLTSPAALFFRAHWRDFQQRIARRGPASAGGPRLSPPRAWADYGADVAEAWLALMTVALGVDVGRALREYLDALARCRQRRIEAVRESDPDGAGGRSWAAKVMPQADDGEGVRLTDAAYRRALAEGAPPGFPRLWLVVLALAGNFDGRGYVCAGNEKKRVRDNHPPPALLYGWSETLARLGVLIAYPALRGLCALVCEHRKNRPTWLPIWGWRDLRAAGTLRSRLGALRRYGRGSGKRGSWLQRIGDTEPAVERGWLK